MTNDELYSDGKWSIVLFCAVFTFSIAFPIVASIIEVNHYSMIGYIDVSIALLMVILAIFIYARRKGNRRKGSRRLAINIYKVLFTVPLLLLIAFFLGVRIKWDILLVGLAWRLWLLALMLEDIVQIYTKTNLRVLGRDYK